MGNYQFINDTQYPVKSSYGITYVVKIWRSDRELLIQPGGNYSQTYFLQGSDPHITFTIDMNQTKYITKVLTAYPEDKLFYLSNLFRDEITLYEENEREDNRVMDIIEEEYQMEIREALRQSEMQFIEKRNEDQLNLAIKASFEEAEIGKMDEEIVEQVKIASKKLEEENKNSNRDILNMINNFQQDMPRQHNHNNEENFHFPIDVKNSALIASRVSKFQIKISLNHSELKQNLAAQLKKLENENTLNKNPYNTMDDDNDDDGINYIYSNEDISIILNGILRKKYSKSISILFSFIDNIEEIIEIKENDKHSIIIYLMRIKEDFMIIFLNHCTARPSVFVKYTNNSPNCELQESLIQLLEFCKYSGDLTVMLEDDGVRMPSYMKCIYFISSTIDMMTNASTGVQKVYTRDQLAVEYAMEVFYQILLENSKSLTPDKSSTCLAIRFLCYLLDMKTYKQYDILCDNVLTALPEWKLYTECIQLDHSLLAILGKDMTLIQEPVNKLLERKIGRKELYAEGKDANYIRYKKRYHITMIEYFICVNQIPLENFYD